MKNQHRLLIILFALVILIQLLASALDIQLLEYVAKPLILPWLVVWFLLHTERSRYRWLVIMALLCSWLGDVLLMFARQNELFFYAGVGGFFLSQLFYILVFAQFFEQQSGGFIRRKPWVILPYLLYLIGIVFLLFPKLDGFMRPIILVYGTSLIGMALAAVNLKGQVSVKAFKLIFLGSLFFLASDSMLAINKFHSELPLSGLWIMSTYIIAQLLIVLGLSEKKPPTK